MQCLLSFVSGAFAGEGVGVAPAAGDVEQFEVGDAAGQGGVDHEVFAGGFQAEHGAQEQQGCPGGPGLWAAGGGVLDGVMRQFPFVSAESFGQPAAEELGGVQDAGGDAGGLLLVAVAA